MTHEPDIVHEADGRHIETMQRLIPTYFAYGFDTLVTLEQYYDIVTENIEKMLMHIAGFDRNTVPVADEPWQNYGDQHQERP